MRPKLSASITGRLTARVPARRRRKNLYCQRKMLRRRLGLDVDPLAATKGGGASGTSLVSITGLGG